jgi:hypothetical protein
MIINRTGTVGPAVLFSGILLTAGLGSMTWVWPHASSILDERIDRSANDERAEVLESQRVRLEEEVAFSTDLATRLAWGTLALADAAQQMELLLRDRIGFDVTCSMVYHAPNLRLGTARYLIGKVEQLLESDPSACAAASARLSAEYAALR